MKPNDQFAETKIVEQTESPSLVTKRLDAEPLIGITLDGRYLIKRRLAHGGFGVIYLASDEKMMSRKVVVKVLHDDQLRNEWSIRKFKQEIEALARVDHPSIVGILDAGEMPDGQPYLVMQYVDGINLRSAMKPEGMDFWRAANIIKQIGRALSAAHERGILHRDLKPENVMLQTLDQGDEQVKIIDFGVAKVKGSAVSLSTAGEHTVGTVAYMSPEQLSAMPLSSASDIYSFAVISYEMLTGRRPTNPESAYQLLEVQRSGVRIKPTDLRPGLPEPAQKMLLTALAFAQEHRFQRARDFGDQLAAALVGDDEQTLVRSAVHLSDAVADPNAETRPLEAAYVYSKDLGNPQVSANLRGPRTKRAHLSKGVIAAAVVVLGLIVGGVWYAARPKTNKQPSIVNPEVFVPAGPEQSLTYWLTVQELKRGKPEGPVFESSGQETYGNGWKFQFNASSTQQGALYLLNEGPGRTGATEYDVLFPTPANNRGVAQVQANQTVQTGWNYFVEQTGVEKLWIIWSAQPVAELDKIFLGAANHQGVIVDAVQIGTLQAYLKKYESTPPAATSDKSQNRTFMKGHGDILVNVMQLSHRAY